VVPVVAGLAVGIALIALFIAFMPFTSQEHQKTNNNHGLYLYLFRFNPSLEDHAILEYSPQLFEKVSQMSGIERPTFDQLHYTISKEGVYNYTNRKIDSYGSTVKIVVSDSIISPTDRSPLNENDISPTARFYYAPMSPATLVFRENGEAFVWTQDYANDPDNHVEPSRIAKVIILPVEAKDFDKINSHYQEVKRFVESFEPRVFADMDNNYCGGSIESVKTIAPFSILIPARLPEGYSLQSVDYVPDVYVIMQNFTRSLCDPSNPYSPDEGVIEIVEAPLSHVSDAMSGEEYVRTEMARYEASNLNATSFVFQGGMMLAVGYDTGTNYNAHLWVVDGKTATIVKIEARSNQTTLQQLAIIARSLKE
jgi:hypothetical protein